MIAKVKAPYVYDTGLKKEPDGKICTTDRKDRIQNVLMTIIFHHVGNRIVIETACLELADILFILYLHMETQTEYNS
jgi:hypothetical protein